ncbi:DUF7694 domain-containing protein [Aliiroseovarius lamellibrachiae]|uniref:DUF7694 domain-containing protein n=1 Tax=Aliiroseovarius lamellibrachiae TaxID=1924933 RepID=UPI001BE0BF7A|nr:hypothetical protein [Aliiroseovarius lamellibrachiae]MBT2131214.1 hypothetical protein [Aliiroseovarius lamellibrachiae]
MQDGPTLRMRRFGFEVHENSQLGHLWVIHDGTITWDQLQAIKNDVWGKSARAIEVYPAECDVVNSLDCRHLWRMGAFDFVPDLLGADDPRDTLEARHTAAWSEARGVGNGD